MALNKNCSAQETFDFDGEIIEKTASEEPSPVETPTSVKEEVSLSANNNYGVAGKSDINVNSNLDSSFNSSEDIKNKSDSLISGNSRENANNFSSSQEETNMPVNRVAETSAVNGLDRATTLRYARLADALNAQSLYAPKAVHLDAGTGALSGGGVEEINKKDLSTAESRAQAIAENLSEKQGGQILDRQDLYKKFPYLTEQTIMQLETAFGKDVSESAKDYYYRMVNDILSRKDRLWNTAYQLDYARQITNEIINTDDELKRLALSQALGLGNFNYSNLQKVYIEESKKIVREYNAALGDTKKEALVRNKMYNLMKSLQQMQVIVPENAYIDTAIESISSLSKNMTEADKSYYGLNN